MWNPFKRPAAPAPAEPPRDPLAPALRPSGQARAVIDRRLASLRGSTAVARTGADGQAATVSAWGLASGEASEALFSWYAAQGFLGYQFSAIVAQHWLVDKACSEPARDAVRHGFTTSIDGLDDEEKQDEALHLIHKANKRMGLGPQMQEFVQFARVFGVRVWIPVIESTDPKYYELPFNPDGVTPGSYRGMTQVDPYWCTPVLDASASSNPAAPGFYYPTWWQINGQLYHHTHVVMCVPFPVADVLKPAYRYGGVPLPQRIMERVYAAERTANEAPLLAMSKRLLVWQTDLAEKLLNQEKTVAHMQGVTEFRDNFGVHMTDTDDTTTQLETSLADLDDVIMSQYVIVAAIAGMPVTKLMGTPPKGMNATGEGDAENYQQSLESIQTNDLDPLLDRHMLLLARSEIEPAMGMAPGTLEITTDWNPVDTPSAKEYAEIEKLKAERDKTLAEAGAIDGMDIRTRLRNDRGGDYTDLAEVAETDPLGLEDPDGGGADPQDPDGGGADPQDPGAAADAAPRPLYVSRKLLNVEDVRAWAKSQGLTLNGEPHVTVTRSRSPVDWMAMGENWSSDQNGNLVIEPGGPRIVEHLGDKGAAVLLFSSSTLAYRHEQMRERGASWDYPYFQPHVTIQYDAAGADLTKVEPYRGKLVFGPEVFADFIDDWRPREA